MVLLPHYTWNLELFDEPMNPYYSHLQQLDYTNDFYYLQKKNMGKFLILIIIISNKKKTRVSKNILKKEGFISLLILIFWFSPK